jgi:hypothetical protein
MGTSLNAVAHNVLMWARRWLSRTVLELARFGLLPWVRDLLRISGAVDVAEGGEVLAVRLNAQAPKARLLAAAFDDSKSDLVRWAKTARLVTILIQLETSPRKCLIPRLASNLS